MNLVKKRIVLKVSGTIFTNGTSLLDNGHALAIINQIQQLISTHYFVVVLGGGNIFRGNYHGKKCGLTSTSSHTIGMLATTINSILFTSLCNQHNIRAIHLSATPPTATATQEAIDNALLSHELMVLSAGIGVPFFTTDTAAIVRALQINAQEVWKGTNVDGVYTANPATDPRATKLSKVSYTDALNNHLGVMDATAYALADSYAITTRVFNIFTPHALITAAQDQSLGSLLYPKDIHVNY